MAWRRLVRITPFPRDDELVRRLAAQMLVDEFRQNWPEAWPTLESAAAEVSEALMLEKTAFAALADDATLLGWIGGQPLYDGRVWELHPLVVRSDSQGRGVGGALVERLEHDVRDRGGITLWVGTDDEANQTSLGGIDLYPGVLNKLIQISNLRRHPMGFYRRLGFEVVGVVPDANGFGKPDILMAKRVAAACEGNGALG